MVFWVKYGWMVVGLVWSTQQIETRLFHLSFALQRLTTSDGFAKWVTMFYITVVLEPHPRNLQVCSYPPTVVPKFAVAITLESMHS